MRSWLPVVTDALYTLNDWYDAPYVFLVQPDQLRQRVEERSIGFREDLRIAMERGDAVSAQEKLLLSYEEVMDSFQGHSLVAITEFLRGMGGIQPEVVIPVGSRGVAGYQNQVKVLREAVSYTHLHSSMRFPTSRMVNTSVRPS